MDPSSIVLHVPHSSTFIPESERGSFRIGLSDELLPLAGLLHPVQVAVVFRHEGEEKEKDGGSDDEADGEVRSRGLRSKA